MRVSAQESIKKSILKADIIYVNSVCIEVDDMIDSYTTNKGQKYSLLGCVLDGKDLSGIREFDKEYREKAERMSKEKKCHVFYNLKKYKSNVLAYDFSQYFLIPIDARDVEMIPLTWNCHSSDFTFGIVYYPGMPDISYAEKMQIRESYWNNTPMTGHQYEEHCAEILRQRGFTNVEVTVKSGDQGIDVTAFKDGKKYGVQCKYYKGSVGNSAVQEVYSGLRFYNCDIGMVMTNSTFTRSAQELAQVNGIILWDNIE